ncbi:peptidase C39 family protein, partial [Pseudomonas syringae group genomosp. 3]
RAEELQIWREATTVFMTYGHADFNRMSCFGADKLRAAVIVFAGPVDDDAPV